MPRPLPDCLHRTLRQEPFPECFAKAWIVLSLGHELREDTALLARMETDHRLRMASQVLPSTAGVWNDDCGAHVLQVGVERERPLVRPPAIDRRLADPACLGDCLDAHAIRANRPQQPVGGRDNGATACLAAGPAAYRHCATNVFGLLVVTRAVLPHMRRQRSGHVLNISSIGGYAASAGRGVYCSTKFAVDGLTEALVLELKPLGIRATVIKPGFFRTDFLDARSVATSGTAIPDYAEAAGAMRQFAAEANHARSGDLRGTVTSQVVNAHDLPSGMPFAQATVRRIEAKNAFIAAELARWWRRHPPISTELKG